MKAYHIPFSSDGDATRAFWEIRNRVSDSGGTHHIAPSLGNGRAFVVLHLPEELTTEQINEITHPHTADEVIVLEITNAQDLPDDEDDDEELFDEEEWDEDDDPSWAFDDDDEEDEDDESEEEVGDELGDDSGEASPVEGTEGEEAATLGSDQGLPF
ncbi:MAG: hypothetical protein KGL39_47840 [Patescibacteria group bacterium]|nr:hypothetical protein [Patescibacteria group bacterium]